MLSGYQRVVKGHYRASAESSSGRVSTTTTTTSVSSSSSSSGGQTLQSEYVVIFLAVFRIASKATDVVVSINIPVRDPAAVDGIHNPDTDAVLAWMENALGFSDGILAMKDIIKSIEILDWDLFDEEEDEE